MKLYTSLTCKAMQIAYEAHREQYDKCGVPYIYHPAYLASQMDTEDGIITALLHDVVEDTSMTLAELANEGFPQAVLDALRLLTHDDGSDYMDYVRRISENPLAVAVKLADLRHNSDPTRNIGLPLEDRVRYSKKYGAAIKLLTEAE